MLSALYNVIVLIGEKFGTFFIFIGRILSWGYSWIGFVVGAVVFLFGSIIDAIWTLIDYFSAKAGEAATAIGDVQDATAGAVALQSIWDFANTFVPLAEGAIMITALTSLWLVCTAIRLTKSWFPLLWA